MNAFVSKLLLAGDKFMPEMHLRRPGFRYSPFGPFTKNNNNKKKPTKNPQEIQNIFIKTNQTKLAFNVI